MKIGFNNNLEALYGIDYCINRDRNVIKQDETEENSYFNDLYRIYIEKVPDEVRDSVASIGDYRRKAEFALNGFGELPDLTPFVEYLDGNREVQNQIVEDIKENDSFKLLNLDQKKDFLAQRRRNTRFQRILPIKSTTTTHFHMCRCYSKSRGSASIAAVCRRAPMAILKKSSRAYSKSSSLRMMVMRLYWKRS